MRISIELFMLDNFIMNLLALKLGEALGGEKGRRSVLCSLLGAVWSLLALAMWPELLSLPGRLLCLGILSLLTAHRGRYLHTLLSLLCAYALLGGSLLLLQVALGLPIQSDGVLLSTVPLRLALYGAAGGMGLVRLLRSLVRRRYAREQEADILLKTGEKVYAFRAFLDSGNLLQEPLSGLPVVLGEGLMIEEGVSLWIDGWGEIAVDRGEVYLPTEGLGPIEVYVGRAPMKLEKGRVIVPLWALPERKSESLQIKKRRNCNESIQTAVAEIVAKAHPVFPTFVPRVEQPAAEPLVVSADGGESACAPDGGGGEPLCPSCPEGGVGKEQAH